jgi:hypothetical protein
MTAALFQEYICFVDKHNGIPMCGQPQRLKQDAFYL